MRLCALVSICHMRLLAGTRVNIHRIVVTGLALCCQASHFA